MKKYGFTSDINSDWKNFETFIEENYSQYFEDKSNLIILKELHKKLFLLKDCIFRLSFNIQPLIKSFGILLNSTIMAIEGNTFNSIAIARPALDIYPKVLLENRNIPTSTNFSNNIEILFKKVKQDYLPHIDPSRKNKKDFSRYCNEFREIIQKKYWFFSDYIHLNDEVTIESHEYISDFLPQNSFAIKNQEQAILELTKLVNLLINLIVFDQCYFFNNNISSHLIDIYTEQQPLELSRIRLSIIK